MDPSLGLKHIMKPTRHRQDMYVHCNHGLQNMPSLLVAEFYTVQLFFTDMLGKLRYEDERARSK